MKSSTRFTGAAWLALAIVAAVVGLPGCEKAEPAASSPGPSQAQAAGKSVASAAVSPAAPAAAATENPSTAAIPELTEPLPPRPAQISWPEAARAFAAANPGNEGLVQLADAMERVDTKAALPQTAAMKRIIQDGWRGAQPGVVALLQSQAPVIDMAEGAADALPFTMPPTTDITSPVPDFLAFQTLGKMLAVKARGLEAQGQRDQAALETVRVLRLASRLRAPRVGLVYHLIGIATTYTTAPTLEAILGSGGLNSQTVQTVGARVFDLDHKTPGIAEAIRTEGSNNLIMIRRMAEDPAYRAEMIRVIQNVNADMVKPLEAAAANPAGYAAEQKKVENALMDYMAKPFWERKSAGDFSVEAITQNPLLVQQFGGERTEMMIRADFATAHLRLIQLQCAIILKNDALIRSIVDPFTGQPFKMNDTRIWSLGPDGIDQGGMTPYEPKNGPFSAGDIAADRPR